MTSQAVIHARGPVKARDYRSMLRDLGALGVLRDVQAICDEEGQPLHEVLGRSREPAFCRTRWRIWLWMHDDLRLRADEIADIWGVAESTVWYGLGRLKPTTPLPVDECRARLELLDALPLAETLCAGAGIGLPDLMSGTKRPVVVLARRTLWRALLSVGRSGARIAAAWGVDDWTVLRAREAA